MSKSSKTTFNELVLRTVCAKMEDNDNQTMDLSDFELDYLFQDENNVDGVIHFGKFGDIAT